MPALIPVLITISEYIYISEYTVFSKFISTLRLLRRRHILFVVVMNGPVTRSHLPAWSGHRESSQDPLCHFERRQSFHNAVGEREKGQDTKSVCQTKMNLFSLER